jgi:hypothetical protein
MRLQSFNRSWVVVIVFCVILGTFAGCDNKKSGKKISEVFQKIKVTDTKGITLEVNNPEIDYSENINAPDSESFGIRVQMKNDIQTIPWEDINHIDINANNKAFPKASIKSADGNILDVTLLKDSENGLSGTTNSGIFQSRLKNIKTIDVIKR